MLPWFIRAIGVFGFVYHGNILAAAVAILALIFASRLETWSTSRWLINTTVLLIGLYTLFTFIFWLGLLVSVICLLLVMTPNPQGQ